MKVRKQSQPIKFFKVTGNEIIMKIIGIFVLFTYYR